MAVWKALLLVYRRLDVKLGRKSDTRFRHIASDAEIADAMDSFRGFPHLVEELTSGAARVDAQIIEVKRTLSSLTRRDHDDWLAVTR